MEKTIGKKLYDLRKQSGFTQDYVAEKLGVSAQAVSKWAFLRRRVHQLLKARA